MIIEKLIPLLIATGALAYVSFKGNKKTRGYLLITSMVWLLTFVWAIGII